MFLQEAHIKQHKAHATSKAHGGKSAPRAVKVKLLFWSRLALLCSWRETNETKKADKQKQRSI